MYSPASLMPYSTEYGFKRAFITVEFLSEDGRWIPVKMQIDTAADVTVLPYDLAMKLTFLSIQMPLYVGEVVGSIAAMKTSVRARILEKTVELPIIASMHVMDPLLGIGGFLDNFEVTFTPKGFRVVPV